MKWTSFARVCFLLIGAYFFQNSFSESAQSRGFTEINPADIYLFKENNGISKVIFESAQY